MKKLALLALTCGSLCAAPVYLGSLEYETAAGGTPPTSPHEFWLKNWTGGVAGPFGLTTSVIFTDISLKIDYDQDGGPSVLNEEAWRIDKPTWLYQPTPTPGDPRTATPNVADYRMIIENTKKIKRAVFSMTVSNVGPWTLQAGGVVTPIDLKLVGDVYTLEMLPHTGPYFLIDDFWGISVDPAIPEPTTVVLAGCGLIGIVIARRRRKG